MSRPSSPSIMVFTRDLRVRDNPALVAACQAEAVVPLFVLDHSAQSSMHRSPNRLGFLAECLADLHASLRARGGALVVRHGPWVAQVLAVAAEVGAADIHVADDVSGFAQRRLAALEAGAAATGRRVHRHGGVTVVPPGAVSPSGGGEFKVFTPYYRKWLDAPWRPVVQVPGKVALPVGLDPGVLPQVEDLAGGSRSPDVMIGGESAALSHMRIWAATHLAEYADRHDDLPGDATSRSSAYLHFGCLSPLEVAVRLVHRPGGEPFVRQLCWRDFYHQVLAARPDAATADYRDRGDTWREDADDLAAWRAGRTGFPVVDAGMRQLRAEGFMHNRARMVVASFLTKDLALDWRLGAAHFMELLVDGDVANNQLNWQWTAGTGTDTNPHRIFHPTVQGQRFDPAGHYIRRYVPELADVPAPEIHEPSAATRARTGYPPAIVDHHEAIAAYRARRQRP